MKQWTDKELHILETMYAEKRPTKEISAVVGHPYSSVNDKITSLGLAHKYPGYTRKYEHDEHFDRLYRIYHHMKDRCNNPNHHEYNNYGGKGIRVCEAWKSFQNFRDWALGNGYQTGLTLDRINNDGDYEPGNCQWITRGENTAKSNHTQHRKSNAGGYVAIDRNGNRIVIDNAEEFARQHGLVGSTIRQRARSKSHNWYGDWRFYNLNEV